MKKVIIILHGWSSSLTTSQEKYNDTIQLLTDKGYVVFAPDLPGFGLNKEIKKEALVFEDYIKFVHTFIQSVLKKTKQKKVILLGHSFGGRLAIRFTAKYPQYVEKLILTGASGIPRPLPSMKKRLVFVVTKLVGPFFSIPPFSFFYNLLRKLVYYSIGEMDYYKSGNLQKTFKNIYQVSIVDDLEKIDVPTDIVWGENDMTTPLQDGEYMHDHIPHSRLHVIRGANHKLPYGKPKEFTKTVLNFLK